MNLLAAILAVFAALVLVACRQRVRGTTLVAPWAWSIFALLAIGSVELTAVWFAARPPWLPHLRFLAAGATFCPLMALLGAKRPQDRGWQFVVLSLWGLVAFYGLTELAYRPHRPPELHWVVRWMLVAPLVTMGLVNHLLTRYWLPAMLVAMGQVVLLSPQLLEVTSLLPEALGLGPRAGDVIALTGIVMLAAAVGLTIAIASRNTNPTRKRGSDAQDSAFQHASSAANLSPASRSLARRVSVDPGFDRVWLDFRDQFGTFWGLRVAARFNQAAEQLGWDVRLTWQGLARVGTARNGAVAEGAKADDPQIQPAMRQVLESLLCRFVDAKWLARRGRDQELPHHAAHPHQGQNADDADCAGMPSARGGVTHSPKA